MIDINLTDDEIIEKVINFGAFDYDNQKMANILNVDLKTIDEFMTDDNSAFKKLYNRGQDLSDYVIDTKLFDLARTGDIKALEKLDRRKIIRQQE